MRQTFHFAAMAAIVLAGTFASCTNDDNVFESQAPELAKANNTIGFNLLNDQMVGTRGVSIESGNTDYLDQISAYDFMVVGHYHATATGTGATPGNLYLGTADNAGVIVDVTNDGSVLSYATRNAANTADEDYYWPAGKLNFQAVSPASDASFSLSNTPTGADEYLSQLTATVTVPGAKTYDAGAWSAKTGTIAAQKDIMFAHAENLGAGDNSGVVNMAFQHALSQVVFKAKISNTAFYADITEVGIVNVHRTGTVGLYDHAGTGTSATAKLDADVTGNADGDYTLIGGDGLVAFNADTDGDSTNDAIRVTSTDPVFLSASADGGNGALLMIPQTTTAWTTTDLAAVPLTTADAAHNSYIKVKLTVTEASSGTKKIDDQYIYLPLAINWAQGYRYTYTLVIGDGEGAYDATGNKIEYNTTPISFTLTVADWTNNVWDPASEGEYGM